MHPLLHILLARRPAARVVPENVKAHTLKLQGLADVGRSALQAIVKKDARNYHAHNGKAVSGTKRLVVTSAQLCAELENYMWIQHKDRHFTKAKAERLIRDYFGDDLVGVQIKPGKKTGARQKGVKGHCIEFEAEAGVYFRAMAWNGKEYVVVSEREDVTPLTAKMNIEVSSVKLRAHDPSDLARGQLGSVRDQ